MGVPWLGLGEWKKCQINLTVFPYATVTYQEIFILLGHFLSFVG